MSKEGFKTRLWCATIFDLDFDFSELADSEKLRYFAYAEEVCPSTLKKHFQFYCYFLNPVHSIKHVSNLLGGAHVEPCRGTLNDNESYCSKESDLIHWGDKPSQGRRTDIEAVMYDIFKTGVSELDIADDNPKLWCMYGRRFESYRDLIQQPRTWKTEVRVFYGDPGTGKTRAAIDWLEEYDNVFFQNDYVMGYKNHENILIDDFDSKTLPRMLFLQMTDRYKMKVNVKYGEMEWNPKRIAITSNFHPDNWYGKSVAVDRRISEILEQK